MQRDVGGGIREKWVRGGSGEGTEKERIITRFTSDSDENKVKEGG